MRKRNEVADPASCLNRAEDGEMTFVLLGRDRAAPLAIRVWAGERIRLGKNQPGDPQILEAYECASTMERERRTTPEERREQVRQSTRRFRRKQKEKAEERP